jgi:hypothetical protein
MFFVLGVSIFSTVSGAVENAIFSTIDISHTSSRGKGDRVAPRLYSYFGLLKYSLFIATISREACTVHMCV